MDICENCNKKNIVINSHYIPNKFYLLCKNCVKTINVCSKTKCKKMFHINDQDLQNLKIIYIENNSIYQFYKYDDIQKLICGKFGNLDNFNKSVEMSKSARKQIKDNTIAIRERKIKELFFQNKIEFRNYGDIYSYIHYGKPNANVVLENEIEKHDIKNKKRSMVAIALKKNNIVFDETLPSCYEYINGLTLKSFEEIIRNIELEHFLKYNTNYDDLRKSHNDIKAKELAIGSYNKHTELIKKNNIIVDFN